VFRWSFCFLVRLVLLRVFFEFGTSILIKEAHRVLAIDECSMADLQYVSDPEGDENNDDTFGSTMVGVGT